MAKQLSLIKAPKLVFGGSLLSGNPRGKRILCTKRPLHLVMRSSKAFGARSFFNYKREINQIIAKQAEAFGVRVYDLANSGNHLHFIVKIQSAKLFSNFLRVVSGLIARLVLRAERARAKLKLGETFWDARPFTRIASWGRAYENLKSYLRINKLEAIGFIQHQPRGRGSVQKRQSLVILRVEPFQIGN